MTIRKLARRTAAAGAAVAMAVTAALTPAQPALAGWDQCAEGWFCMWENNAYTGYFYALLNADSPNFGGAFNDKMTSYWNRSGETYIVFMDSNYNGGCYWVSPGESTSAVSSSGNDLATSARRWNPSDNSRFCQF